MRTLLPPASEDFAFFVVPPFTALAAAREAIGDAPLLLGAQNMHWADAGAFTGEISAAMLSELSIDLVELGHSERRQLFGETDQALNLKVKTALRYGLRPLLCVGDTAEERDAGASAEAVVRQVKLAFARLSPGDVGRCLIAYEPIWAIGEGGVAATPDHIREIHQAINQATAELTPGSVPVLYGGSVTADNAPELAAEATVDGLFIGRAAWEATRFAAMIRTAISARASLPRRGRGGEFHSGDLKIKLRGNLALSQRRGGALRKFTWSRSAFERMNADEAESERRGSERRIEAGPRGAIERRQTVEPPPLLRREAEGDPMLIALARLKPGRREVGDVRRIGKGLRLQSNSREP